MEVSLMVRVRLRLVGAIALVAAAACSSNHSARYTATPYVSRFADPGLRLADTDFQRARNLNDAFGANDARQRMIASCGAIIDNPDANRGDRSFCNTFLKTGQR